MEFFDVGKDELLRLSETELEELIARLAEAEIGSNGYSPAFVNWSGSINAPDEGVDVRVQVPVDKFRTGFIERPDTIFQAKKHSMPKSSIEAEMSPSSKLLPIISSQAENGGSYIIVSLEDDCSPPMLKSRIETMQNALVSDQHGNRIHLDFYDRSRLVQWLRQHSSVILWVKGKIGQGYSGWQPYGSWSNPPHGVKDNLISAPGVAITLPSGRGDQLCVADAISSIRGLVNSTSKALRITGLSGVGKTRIVQALFDETIGSNALDRTKVLYVDTADEPFPSATVLLDRLLAEDRRAFMIIDNCPPDLHSLLASKLAASGNQVRLITVEYDIRDDKPQTTEVIHIESQGPELAQKLLTHRFPSIGSNNARRIAEFSDGNARVSLAIAERVHEGESLAQLSDTQLFNRLFEQRNHPDEDLREQAEILSLVYSFSVSNSDEEHDELEILSSTSDYSRNQLFRSVKKLTERDIVQKRGVWRAILPQAVANKLASSSLDSIPVEQLRMTFERSGCQRLLMSFAHRLGFLHEHSVAQQIAEAWLQPNGLLGLISSLDEFGIRMLEYVGPLVPEALLDRIEDALNVPGFQGLKPYENPRRSTILHLLQSLAYEPNTFERSVELLIQIADHEDENNNFDPVRGKILNLFQARFSGTHASINQRIAIMEACFFSGRTGRRELGLLMLSTALGKQSSIGSRVNDFGARPRNSGALLNYDELIEWRSEFIEIAVRLGTSGNTDLEGRAREVFATVFRILWRQKATRNILVDAARRLNSYNHWTEGWKAVRRTIYFDYTNSKSESSPPNQLVELSEELAPRNLITRVMTFVLGVKSDYWALDVDFVNRDDNRYRDVSQRFEAKALGLGEEFAESHYELDELCPYLFSNDWMPYRFAFGRGLAKGSTNIEYSWNQLVNLLEQMQQSCLDFSVFRGFIEEVNRIDSSLTKRLLDQCTLHNQLQSDLVHLHPNKFTEVDLDRCMTILDNFETPPWMFGSILYEDKFSNLPDERIIDLANRLLLKAGGDEVVIEALSLKWSDEVSEIDVFDSELRKIGLKAVTQRFLRDQGRSDDLLGHRMEVVVGSALRFKGNEIEKHGWLSAIFQFVDKSFGYVLGFETVIELTASLMPEAFINSLNEGTEKQISNRLLFLRRIESRNPLFARVDIDILIESCCSVSNEELWVSVAASIDIWTKVADQEDLTMSDSAIRLLEASPDPKLVLDAYAEQVKPSVWIDGGLVDLMMGRVNAIGGLVEHERIDIAMAAKVVYKKLVGLIDDEKEIEQIINERREQRFE